MNLWNIPAGRPFLDCLVEGLHVRVGRDPLALAGAQIILPTRRAVRSLREAFLRASDGALLLLPRLLALGDLDSDELDLALPGGGGLDLPPAIAPIRRELLLARAIRQRSPEVLPGQALALAGDLATLIDQVHTQRSSFDRLTALVPAELAQHWQVTVEFLQVVTSVWPELLAIEGALDPADRRNRLIEAQIDAWGRTPPVTPLIAAGLDATIPAVADLLAAIADLPTGAVVLDGLDAAADDTIWDAARGDCTHPQHALAGLLSRLGVERAAVPAWSSAPSLRNDERARLIREVMRPSSVSEHWRTLATLAAGATDGMTRLDLHGTHEEAAAVALLLREQLETPAATAMLVTPDRDLARRVAAELRRWGIEIDDSAGRPLGRTPPGAFLRLVADAVAEDLAPVPLLSLLKHPLTALGLDPIACRELVRRLETGCLRGPRPAPGLAGLRAVAQETDAAAIVDRLTRSIADLALALAAPAATLADLIRLHIAAAETLAATDTMTGAERLWAGEAGEAAATFVAELAAAAVGFDSIDGADYPMLFEAALGGKVVRPVAGRHPRLQILGTLEARLQSADLVVIGGLNEGTWPPDTGHDPWMSRPMRAQFGLAPAERAIGIAAHDFTIALAAPTVVLTRALRSEGAPTVPSRWLLRLETVLTALQLGHLPLAGNDRAPVIGWQSLLDRPQSVRPVAPPAPRPPLHARPRKLSVTAIETWMRDPYALYARTILRLNALEPLDSDPSVADRGRFIHTALARFIATRAALPVEQWPSLLIELGREAFGDSLLHPGVRSFWWPRFVKIAAWVIELEADRLPSIAAIRPEVRGALVLAGLYRPFTLTAHADRIEQSVDGTLGIVDYKTGTPPKGSEVAAGYAPQLPLEALIAEAGGFNGVPAAKVEALAFWHLAGTRIAGAVCHLEDIATLVSDAGEGLRRLVERFDDPMTPYLARPRPAMAPRYSDYEHLARVKEWSTGGDEPVGD